MGQVEAGAGTSEGSEALPPWAWGLMATLCVAQVLEVLGVTVVIVALPVIGADLGLPDAQLQLVVSLYAVLYGGLLLTAGRVADLLDRRTVFAAGLVVTLAGAVLCASAGTGTMLLLGRAVQGLGGAIVTPAALSLLTSSFPAGRARRVAVSATPSSSSCAPPTAEGAAYEHCQPSWPHACLAGRSSSGPWLCSAVSPAAAFLS